MTPLNGGVKRRSHTISLVHFLPSDLKEVCRFIEHEANSYPVKDLCEVIGIDRSSYYRSLKPRASNCEEILSGELVLEVFHKHSRRYGSRRVEAELKAQGVAIGRHRIRRLMKEQGFMRWS